MHLPSECKFLKYHQNNSYYFESSVVPFRFEALIDNNIKSNLTIILYSQGENEIFNKKIKINQNERLKLTYDSNEITISTSSNSVVCKIKESNFNSFMFAFPENEIKNSESQQEDSLANSKQLSPENIIKTISFKDYF